MDEWIQLATMTVIAMCLLALLVMVAVVYILQGSYKTHLESVNQVSEQDTVASEKIKVGSLTSTNSIVTTTEIGTVDSLITHETLDKAIEQLDSLSTRNRSQVDWSQSRFRKLVSSVK